MAKKHRKKSSSKHRKQKKSRKTRKEKKSKSRTTHSRKKSRERGSRHDDRRKRDHSGSRKINERRRPPPIKQSPDFTNAAMNENLGNIVLVRNRRRTPQTSDTNLIGAERQNVVLTPRDATAARTLKTADQGPKTIPINRLTPVQPSSVTPIRKEYPYGFAGSPMDVKTLPLSRTSLSTTTTPMPTGTTVPATPEPGGIGSTAPVGTGTTTVEPIATALDKSDELTKKEVAQTDPEKCGCDKAQKWKTYMEKVTEGGSEAMQADFRLIRGYLPPTATRTAFDANMEKNRFEDVVCIDQTRVRLNCGTYIHASWVNITATKKAILTQLPVRESAGEFWQMILDTDVQAILLILTHAEYNMFHGNWVFPSEQDFLHFEETHIRVGEFKRIVIDREWTMHVISVRNGDHKKFVHMHHYSGWTHGKQPVRILDLWQIQSTFRKYASPHVYMSLSGCGRAGTYAAFEIAHERLHSDDFTKLNINDCVCRARNGRMHAVQRPIQMQTIHACIMEHIMTTKFASQLSPKTLSKYEEFSTRFNKCAELQEDMP